MSERSPEAWNDAAATFDESADHSLRDPRVRSAWVDLLAALLPPAPSLLADLGCGTGSLALVAADLGHHVVGVDFSQEMLVAARSKATGRDEITFAVGDASAPPLVEGVFDAVLCRHVLWALPDPEAALGLWVNLLRPRGRIILIEGRWSTGTGLPSEQVAALLRQQGFDPKVHPLLDEHCWGGPVADERYAVTAQAPTSWADRAARASGLLDARGWWSVPTRRTQIGLAGRRRSAGSW